MSGVIELSIGSRRIGWRGRRGIRGRVIGRGHRDEPVAASPSASARRASASRIALTTASTVSSKRLPSVSMIRASSAARSGATARLVSSSSRRRSAARISSASGPSGSRPRSSVRRRARSSTEACEEELEVGVGQDDRADVAAGHDDAARRREVALALQEGGPHAPDRRDRRDRGVDGRTADIVGVVDAVDQDAATSRPVGVRGELDLVDERTQTLGVVEAGTPRASGQPGDRAVQQPRVAEAVAELERRGRADAALARRAGPIEGDDQIQRIACASISPRSARAPGRRSVATRARVTRPAPAQAADLGRLQRPDAAALAGRRSGPGPIRTRTRRTIGAPDRAEHPPQLALPALGEDRPIPDEVARGRGEELGRVARVSRSVIGRRPVRRRPWPSSSSMPARSAIDLLGGQRRARARSRTRARRRGGDAGRGRPSRRRW